MEVKREINPKGVSMKLISRHRDVGEEDEIADAVFVFIITEDDAFASPPFDVGQLELFLKERVQEFMKFGSED
jgi:hypothetical protein